MAYNVIFDIDQTVADTSRLEEFRNQKNWDEADRLIDLGEIGLFPGLADLILEARDKGHNIIFVSSSPRHYSEHVLQAAGLSGFPLVAYQDTKKHKPDPEPYLFAMEHFGKGRMAYVIVGDSISDITAANGIPDKTVFALRCTWGISKERFSEEKMSDRKNGIPFMYIETVSELREFIFHKWETKKVDGTPEVYGFTYYPVGRGKHTDLFSRAFFQDIKGQELDEKPAHPVFQKRWVVSWATKFLTSYIKAVLKEYELADSSKLGISIVPSSSEGKWNAALKDEIVPEILKKTGASDCSELLRRHTSRISTHKDNNRTVATNLETIRIEPDQAKRLKSLEILVVMDDITTSGNTFEACREIIERDAGNIFHGKILSAAIAKTGRPLSAQEQVKELYWDLMDENEPFY